MTIELIDTGKEFLGFKIKSREDMFGTFYYIVGIKTFNDAKTIAELWKEENKLNLVCSPHFNVFGENEYSVHI